MAACAPDHLRIRPPQPERRMKTLLYASTGPELALYDIDFAGAAVEKRSTSRLPVNVQYAWPHPSGRFLYAVASNGGPAVKGDTHLAIALRIETGSGELR